MTGHSIFDGTLLISMRKIYLVLTLCSSTCFAQFKNILLDSGSISEKYAPCEPSIAINLKNPKNIVAGAILNKVYVTQDGGASWQKSGLKSPLGVYGDPVIISDDKGNFYYFHLSDPEGKGWESEKLLDQIVVQKSSDGGSTWSEGESIGMSHPKDNDKPWASTDDKGNVYVAWTQFDTYGSKDPNCRSNLYLSTSGNGKKWNKPFQLSQIPGDCIDNDSTVMGGMPAITPDGKIFVAWSNQGLLFLDRSYDKGNTWLTNDVAITKQAGGWNMNIPGLGRSNGLPVLLADNTKGRMQGALYLLWADQHNGENNTDIWFSRSTNFGDNWTSPLRVNNDGSTKHQFMPWMTVDQSTGYIYVIFYDRRAYEDNQTDVYLAYSTDGGNNFKNVKISESPFTPTEGSFFGDYTNISAHKGIITPIWTRMDNGKTSVWTSIIKQEDLIK